MSEPQPVTPLNEADTLRNQLRALGGMVLTLAQHVADLAAVAAAAPVAGGAAYDDSAVQLQLTELRGEVEKINATIGE
jgi:hypothetical protein